MSDNRSGFRGNLASLVLLAAAAALPDLGQQRTLRPRPNVPGEPMAPPAPSPFGSLTARERRYHDMKTQFDIDRIDAAEAKRARRHARDLENERRGSRRQLATPRKAPA